MKFVKKRHLTIRVLLSNCLKMYVTIHPIGWLIQKSDQQQFMLISGGIRIFIKICVLVLIYRFFWNRKKCSIIIQIVGWFIPNCSTICIRDFQFLFLLNINVYQFKWSSFCDRTPAKLYQLPTDKQSPSSHRDFLKRHVFLEPLIPKMCDTVKKDK